MASRTDDPAAYARRKAYFAGRAVAQKRLREGSRLDVTKMMDEALWMVVTHAIRDLENSTRLHAAPDEMTMLQNLKAAVLELEQRGIQLQLNFGD